jgi:hypothetical protein
MQFCGALLDQHAAMQAHAAPPPAAPIPPPVSEAEPQHVIELEAEHSGSSEPAEESHAMPQHFSAPVSRGSERYAMGDYEPPTAGSVRLSKAEVEHAEASGISTEEYAKQKLRMMKLKKAKVIRDE